MRDSLSNILQQHEAKYNGWSNYNTWNVALWIQNDEHLYHIAKTKKTYEEFADYMNSIGERKTPDNVFYGDCLNGYGVLNLNELNDLIGDIYIYIYERN